MGAIRYTNTADYIVSCDSTYTTEYQHMHDMISARVYVLLLIKVAVYTCIYIYIYIYT